MILWWSYEDYRINLTMVGDQQTLATKKQEPFLYRVFRADSIHNLEQQTFTYLGAEIYFDEQGKVYRYEEPEFDFAGFHEFLRDKYENYHIDEFILVTREGQFNIRYFPLTEYAPEEHTELVDDIELVGYRMFPDLLPIGADLLLSVLDTDPMEDIEGSIETFEKLLRFVQGDQDVFLKIQILMNLDLLYSQLGRIEKSRFYFQKAMGDNLNLESLKNCRWVRLETKNDVIAPHIFRYDLGYIHHSRGYHLQLTSDIALADDKIRHYKNAISCWKETEYPLTDDIFNAYIAIAETYGLELGDYDLANQYYLQGIDTIKHKDQLTINQKISLAIAYYRILDFYSAQTLLQAELDLLTHNKQTQRELLIHLGKSHLYKEPKKAASCFEDAIKLGKNDTLYDYIEMNNTYRILHIALYLARDFDALEDSIMKYLGLEHRNDPSYFRTKEISEVFMEIIEKDFSVLHSYLLNTISKATNTKKSSLVIRQLLWMYLNELVNAEKIESLSIVKDLDDLVGICSTYEFHELAELMGDLIPQLEKLNWGDLTPLTTEQIEFSNIPSHLNNQQIIDIIQFLLARSIVIYEIS